MSEFCRNQQGAFSVLALSVLLIMLAAGTGIFFLSQRNYASGQRELKEMRLFYAARDGAEAGRVKLERESSAVDHLKETDSVLMEVDTKDGIHCVVSALKRGNEIVILSISQNKAQESERAVCHLETVQGYYHLIYWEP